MTSMEVCSSIFSANWGVTFCHTDTRWFSLLWAHSLTNISGSCAKHRTVVPVSSFFGAFAATNWNVFFTTYTTWLFTDSVDRKQNFIALQWAVVSVCDTINATNWVPLFGAIALGLETCSSVGEFYPRTTNFTLVFVCPPVHSTDRVVIRKTDTFRFTSSFTGQFDSFGFHHALVAIGYPVGSTDWLPVNTAWSCSAFPLLKL